jgi:DNA-binding CsgD family transcriptional regulator
VPTAFSSPGFILLDEEFKAIAFNHESIQILAFPTAPEKIQLPSVFLSDRIRSRLLRQNAGSSLSESGTDSSLFVKEYRSGGRQYLCRIFQVDDHDPDHQLIRSAILLERNCSTVNALEEMLEQFNLTPRELETVRFLVEGLTSKEIAERMNISPNTVKAFLRIVMVKMGVSTRSGIVGKVVGPHS